MNGANIIDIMIPYDQDTPMKADKDTISIIDSLSAISYLKDFTIGYFMTAYYIFIYDKLLLNLKESHFSDF